MSTQPKPTTKYVRVCDLCGDPVDEYGHRDWAALNVGHGGRSPKEPGARRFNLRFFRKHHGDRASGAPKGDYRSWEWDFHGECLVSALTPLVREEARPRPLFAAIEGETKP